MRTHGAFILLCTSHGFVQQPVRLPCRLAVSTEDPDSFADMLPPKQTSSATKGFGTKEDSVKEAFEGEGIANSHESMSDAVKDSDQEAHLEAQEDEEPAAEIDQEPEEPVPGQDMRKEPKPEITVESVAEDPKSEPEPMLVEEKEPEPEPKIVAQEPIESEPEPTLVVVEEKDSEPEPISEPVIVKVPEPAVASAVSSKSIDTFFIQETSDNLVSKNKPSMENVLELVQGKPLFSKLTEDLGNRGEEYVLGQLVILSCIVSGQIPFNAFKLLGGLSLVGGGVVILASLAALGIDDIVANIFVKKEGGSLLQEGVYEQVRHPMYAGLLVAAGGYSLATDSASSLLCTGLLWYFLDTQVTEAEEKSLVDKFGAEYEDYMREVTGKFIPNELISDPSMPWNVPSPDED